MPTYLCHGFRWHRRDLRVYVILNDIEDAASNWVVGPATSFAILSHFHARFNFLPDPAPLPLDVVVKPRPSTERPPRSHDDDDFTVPPPRVPESRDPVLSNSWSAVKLLEEFDPEDTRLPCRPYAYVADYVVRVDLSANVVDEMAKYRMRQQDEWFHRLRDELQKGEDIRWYVVVCGDDVREVPVGSEDEANCNDDIDYDSEEEYVDDNDDSSSTPAAASRQGLKLPPIKPPPLQPIQQERPRTSPGPSSLPLRPSPLSSHPPLPTPPAEPGGQKPPARPPLKNKKSMAEGLRRLFGKKDSVPGPR
ncbi:AorFlbE-like protein [Dactylonectria estremocensis]|uniref:AorFlbE-like protein n=1 Tax=Dactylonectria estremocensis TaxID=1079267 RepID=A0A9P9JG97_9HYPO|nr:AorFlbE-like protein [Dactylonectria estremocensis]